MIYGNEEMDKYIISIPDFPKEGIIFRDITSVLGNPDGFKLAIDTMQKALEGVEFDAIVALDARGFFFGSPLAFNNHKPLIPVRKAGKLPRATLKKNFQLEYGEESFEIHKDDIKPGMKVVIVDDLLATGGTLGASAKLCEELGAEVVKMLVVIELKGLNGREILSDYSIDSVIAYEGK